MGQAKVESAAIDWSQEIPAGRVRPHHHALALLIASVSVFVGTGIFYYHFVRLGSPVEHNWLTDSLISLHDLLGWPSIFVVSAIPFTWSLIFFFSEKIEYVGLKIFGWICGAAFLSLLLGLLAGEALGGTFGSAIAFRMEAVLGRGGSLAILALAEFMALFLATERFFILRKTAAPRRTDRENLIREETGVTNEESSLLDSSTTATLPGEEAEVEEDAQEEDSAEEEMDSIEDEEKIETQKEEAPEDPVPQTEEPAAGEAVEAKPPVVQKSFDLEEVLEIEKEDPSARETVDDVIPPPDVEEDEATQEEEGEENEESALEEETIGEEESVVLEKEDGEAGLNEAVERATQDYMIPQKAPAAEEQSVSEPEAVADAEEPEAAGGLLNQAARLVIEQQRASVSMLQRRLAIPFTKASLLMDVLEREGVIGPYRGGPAREILIGMKEWEEQFQEKRQDSSNLPQA